jgi:hypothetical protein
MHANREELVKGKVFPKLRKLCEKRDVTWGDVDLRWGVTEERKVEGAVLPICFAEIDRCRPYFIGLLGERYGWVPDIPPRFVQYQPWLSEYGNRSVTELEFLYGALNHPASGHAFFYFRNPDYIDSLPEPARDIHREGLCEGSITGPDCGKRSRDLGIRRNCVGTGHHGNFRIDCLLPGATNS